MARTWGTETSRDVTDEQQRGAVPPPPVADTTAGAREDRRPLQKQKESLTVTVLGSAVCCAKTLGEDLVPSPAACTAEHMLPLLCNHLLHLPWLARGELLSIREELTDNAVPRAQRYLARSPREQPCKIPQPVEPAAPCPRCRSSLQQAACPPRMRRQRGSLASPKPPLPSTRYWRKVFLVTGCLRGKGNRSETGAGREQELKPKPPPCPESGGHPVAPAPAHLASLQGWGSPWRLFVPIRALKERAQQGKEL